jgi:hypothetical protein
VQSRRTRLGGERVGVNAYVAAPVETEGFLEPRAVGRHRLERVHQTIPADETCAQDRVQADVRADIPEHVTAPQDTRQRFLDGAFVQARPVELLSLRLDQQADSTRGSGANDGDDVRAGEKSIHERAQEARRRTESSQPGGKRRGYAVEQVRESSLECVYVAVHRSRIIGSRSLQQ